jgi:hypothetical protein
MDECTTEPFIVTNVKVRVRTLGRIKQCTLETSLPDNDTDKVLTSLAKDLFMLGCGSRENTMVWANANGLTVDAIVESGQTAVHTATEKRPDPTGPYDTMENGGMIAQYERKSNQIVSFYLFTYLESEIVPRVYDSIDPRIVYDRIPVLGTGSRAKRGRSSIYCLLLTYESLTPSTVLMKVSPASKRHGWILIRNLWETMVQRLTRTIVSCRQHRTRVRTRRYPRSTSRYERGSHVPVHRILCGPPYGRPSTTSQERSDQFNPFPWMTSISLQENNNFFKKCVEKKMPVNTPKAALA